MEEDRKEEEEEEEGDGVCESWGLKKTNKKREHRHQEDISRRPSRDCRHL